jgi:galactokinase
MQIVSQAKKGAMKSLQKDIEASIPNIKRFANKITGVFVNLKKDREKIEKGLESVKEKVAQGVDIGSYFIYYNENSNTLLL